MATRKVTLITMSQGNVIALKRTIDSFLPFVDEIVYGDMLIFDEDREFVRQYEKEYPLRSIRLPFNYIFHVGFSGCLNYLISNAKNDMCLYMNTSEVIDENYGINDIINNNPDCNSFYFSHRVESHRWFRASDRRDVQWDGRIHEEPVGNIRPYHKPIFMMADTEKDMQDEFKASVFNSIKEIVYWNQLMRIVDNPKEQGVTNDYWVNFAKEQYASMNERLVQKGKQVDAFKYGDFNLFLSDIKTSDYFEKEKFESNDSINFQGTRKVIL
jgi:hypothetical protein